MNKPLVSRAERMIMVRDKVLANVLEAVAGEGVGKVYLESLAKADEEVNAALKAKGFDLD